MSSGITNSVPAARRTSMKRGGRRSLRHAGALGALGALLFACSSGQGSGIEVPVAQAGSGSALTSGGAGASGASSGAGRGGSRAGGSTGTSGGSGAQADGGGDSQGGDRSSGGAADSSGGSIVQPDPNSAGGQGIGGDAPEDPRTGQAGDESSGHAGNDPGGPTEPVPSTGCDAPGTIFAGKCATATGCHGGDNGGFRVQLAVQVPDVLGRLSAAERCDNLLVDPAQVERSLLLLKVRAKAEDRPQLIEDCGGSPMPLYSEESLTSEEIDCIRSWIAGFPK